MIPCSNALRSHEDLAMRLSQRFQALGLVLVLLALPIAVIAGAYACAPQECTKLCCAAHRGHSMNGMHMNCAGMHRAACICMLSQGSQHSPDFMLLAPLPPTQLSAETRLLPPQSSRISPVTFTVLASAGFSSLPFQPPRS